MPKIDKADQVHKEAIVIDGRDPTHLMYGFTRAPKDEYIGILQAGGLTAVVVDAAWVDDVFGQAARAVAAWHHRVAAMGESARIIYTVDDIQEAKRTGKVGFILSFQSPSPVEDDLDLVDMWRNLGIRVMQLTYQTRNLVGDGCAEQTDCGLSNFGERLVQHLNECGIVVDLSHAGNQTAMDATQCSKQPVILSHTNARSLCDLPRNASDELLKRVAKSGGVVGVSAYSAIVKKGGGETGTTLQDYLDQVDFMIGLLGEDHVGVGLDVGELRSAVEVEMLHARIAGAGKQPQYRYVEDLNTRAKARNLTQGLLDRGYNESTIQKVLGGNFLRVFAEVWAVST